MAAVVVAVRAEAAVAAEAAAAAEGAAAAAGFELDPFRSVTDLEAPCSNKNDRSKMNNNLL